jgi:hypothetical protein
MLLPIRFILPGLLLAACHDSPPPVSGPAKTAPLPRQALAVTPLPDSVRAAQRVARTYVLDTLVLITSRNLQALLTEAEETELVSYTAAKAVPPVVQAFLEARGGVTRPFIMADVGSPFEKTCTPLDEALPRKQLVYLGVSPDLVLLSYYSGGIGLAQHVVIFQLQGLHIRDVWNGYVQNDPKTKAELLKQVVVQHNEQVRQKGNNSGGLFF